jgi:hypothetical protein
MENGTLFYQEWNGRDRYELEVDDGIITVVVDEDERFIVTAFLKEY